MVLFTLVHMQLDGGGGKPGGAGITSSSTIACLASDTRHGLLAAATQGGRVTVFKHSGASAASSGNADPAPDLSRQWDAQPAFSVGAGLSSLTTLQPLSSVHYISHTVYCGHLLR
jgi:hypothetical protein